MSHEPEDDPFDNDFFSDAEEVDPAELDAAVADAAEQIEGDTLDDILTGYAAKQAVDTGVVDSMAPDFGNSQESPHEGNAGDGTLQEPSLDAQLAGGMPLFIMHKSHQLSSRLPEAARVAQRVTHGRVGIGVAIRLPKLSPKAARTFLDRFSPRSLRIADPEIYTHPGSNGSPAAAPPARTAARYPYMGIMPTVPDSTWINDVFEDQYAAGATVLLSASGWVSDSHGRTELSKAMEWVHESRATAGVEAPMFVNLTMDGRWLADPKLRNLLLEEIVESEERLWWLRFYWPIVEPRYGQLRDRAILDGYRELSVTAALEDKVLVLPNTGLTGWVATALGASGWTTGPSWPEQAFAAQKVIASQPGVRRRPHVQRYFERTILHTADQPSHSALLRETDYLLCRCRYCRSIAADSPGIVKWDKERAAMHYLIRAARLADLLSDAGRRRIEALREVRRARRFVASVAGTPAALAGASNPAHLADWERLLV